MKVTVERVGHVPYRQLTIDEFCAEAAERFGPHSLDWAFQCPRCGNIATGHDFPPDRRQGLGQECVGRHVEGVDCNWVAYGLIHGPWEILMEDGHSAYSFPFAPPVNDSVVESAQEIPG